MTLRRREHPDAHQELLAAARWYDEQRLGLGLALLDRVDSALARVLGWPEAAVPVSRGQGTPTVRSMSVEDFPYRIVYLVSGDELVVIAYAHLRRRPGYWRRRL